MAQKRESSPGCGIWVVIIILFIVVCNMKETDKAEKEELRKQIRQMKQEERREGNNHWGKTPDELERELGNE